MALEDMRGADLIAAACRSASGSRLSLPTKLEDVDNDIWLNVDSYSLMQGIYLVARLADEFGIREIRFALADAGTLAHLDVVWTGAPLGSRPRPRGRPTRWSWAARRAR
ncbi:MAG: hypothetical protein U1F54_15530 [Burkholderiales bacterium]